MILAFDGMTLSYFIQATSLGYHPAADPDRGKDPDLADQRVAAVRLYLYNQPAPFTTPTTWSEVHAIVRPEAQPELHHRFAANVLGEVLAEDLDEARVRARVGELLLYHKKVNDCRIVAECEAAPAPGIDVLATNDHNLIDRLGGRTRLALMTPAACFDHLGIPRGTDPLISVGPGHPLFGRKWWRW